nr:immunoglobulin light chain junction region [Macaca mulatta]MOX11447.1 immunoglobulin light chain junction region [Macaca mulatta]MOX11453.1 immunoglobulin light chain junction region [Macaca mulatta]MOX11536.1 immunoglobulin light chain junction region [Macaca mulatta]MOX11589.1 immunoglobulin light chain junction region [Macaca mulatta]
DYYCALYMGSGIYIF